MSLINSTLAEYYAAYGIDIFDPEDLFFNDLCFPFQTENGTDITLQDRRQDIFQNLSLCEENCEYEQINIYHFCIFNILAILFHRLGAVHPARREC